VSSDPSIRSLAQQHGISHQTLGARLRNGMTLQQAVSTPLRVTSRIPEPEQTVQSLGDKRRLLRTLRDSIELELQDLPAEQRLKHRYRANQAISLIAQIEEDLLRHDLQLRQRNTRPSTESTSCD
jgi:hypothetical protein